MFSANFKGQKPKKHKSYVQRARKYMLTSAQIKKCKCNNKDTYTVYTVHPVKLFQVTFGVQYITEVPEC